MPVWMELVLPVVGATMVSLLLRRRTEGLWQVLEVLAQGRAAAVLERERRATATQLIKNLPEGGRWDEVDDTGRRRTIDVVVRPSTAALGPSTHERGPAPRAVTGISETPTAGETR